MKRCGIILGITNIAIKTFVKLESLLKYPFPALKKMSCTTTHFILFQSQILRDLIFVSYNISLLIPTLWHILRSNYSSNSISAQTSVSKPEKSALYDCPRRSFPVTNSEGFDFCFIILLIPTLPSPFPVSAS